MNVAVDGEDQIDEDGRHAAALSDNEDPVMSHRRKGISIVPKRHDREVELGIKGSHTSTSIDVVKVVDKVAPRNEATLHRNHLFRQNRFQQIVENT